MVKKSKKLDFNLDAGTFTEQAKNANMSIDNFSKKVIKNYKANKEGKKVDYNPNLKTYRRAIFYENSKKFKKK